MNIKRIKAKFIYLVFLTALVFSLGAIPGMAHEVNNSELMAQVFAAAEAELGGH